jgi:hypothetical protein
MRYATTAATTSRTTSSHHQSLLELSLPDELPVPAAGDGDAEVGMVAAGVADTELDDELATGADVAGSVGGRVGPGGVLDGPVVGLGVGPLAAGGEPDGVRDGPGGLSVGATVRVGARDRDGLGDVVIDGRSDDPLPPAPQAVSRTRAHRALRSIRDRRTRAGDMRGPPPLRGQHRGSGHPGRAGCVWQRNRHRGPAGQALRLA